MTKKTDPDAIGPGKCRLCPRYAHAQSICLSGHGSQIPEYVLIIGFPSQIDDTWCISCQRPCISACHKQAHQSGQLLSDAAGQALHTALVRATIGSGSIFYTSAVRCAGPRPGMVPIRRCRAYLLDELASLNLSKCRGIMLLGDTAVQSVLNKGHISVKETRLRVINQFAPPWGPPIRATYHPVELLLRYEGEHNMEEMIGDFLDIQKQRDPVIPAPTMPWLGDLPIPRILGLDLEWTQKNTIRCAAISDGTWKIVVPGDHLANLLRWLDDNTTERITP